MSNEGKTPWVEHFKTLVILVCVAGLTVAMVLIAYKFLGTTGKHTGNVEDRISDIWASIQAIGLISGIIGVLITVLVLYFSLSNSAQISNAIADFEKQKAEIKNETRESLNRIKKEIRESSIEFRMEVEKRIGEEDRHQLEIESKLQRLQDNLQGEIRKLTIETSIQSRQIELKSQLATQEADALKKELTSHADDLKKDLDSKKDSLTNEIMGKKDEILEKFDSEADKIIEHIKALKGEGQTNESVRETAENIRTLKIYTREINNDDWKIKVTYTISHDVIEGFISRDQVGNLLFIENRLFSISIDGKDQNGIFKFTDRDSTNKYAQIVQQANTVLPDEVTDRERKKLTTQKERTPDPLHSN